MREMWELPGRTTKQHAVRITLVLVLVWALAAVPLTLWLTLRKPAPVPIPAQRELTVMDTAAVDDAQTALNNGFVHVESQITTSVARFQVVETVRATSGESIGKVQSGAETADLLAASDTVFLRGDSAFWSTFGVPTSFAGWVDVGEQLGSIPFPLHSATAALVPNAIARVDNTAVGATQTVYRTDKASAVFTPASIVSITFGGRTASVAPGAADVSTALASARDELSTGVGKLVGTSGALTVSEPPPPPKG